MLRQFNDLESPFHAVSVSGTTAMPEPNGSRIAEINFTYGNQTGGRTDQLPKKSLRHNGLLV
jgi:hypothetical protein